MKGIVCSGAVIHDTVVHPVADPQWGTTSLVETLEPHIGGNAANTSVALATLGTRVRVMGAVGDDEQGRFVVSALQRAGVETDAIGVVGAPTAATVALVNSGGARMFLHRPGASAIAFSAPLDFPADRMGGISHYHLASLFILPNFRPHAPVTLARARAAGLATSLDTNWDPRGRWMLDLAPCLPDLDYLFMNEDEARMATGETEPEAAAKAVLALGARVAVIKLGPRGCAIYTADYEVRCPAFEVDVKDTTGAGDCFVAGFLAARLRGASLEEAGRFANAVGAFSVQCVGAAIGVKGYEETENWMRCGRPVK